MYEPQLLITTITHDMAEFLSKQKYKQQHISPQAALTGKAQAAVHPSVD